MTSPDIHTLTGAYALDALDEFERRQFQAHLTRCPDCTREVDELRATGAKLGLAVAAQPPDSLRRKVMAEVVATRQDSPAPRAADTTSGAPGATGRAGWPVRLTAIAAAASVVAAVVLGVATVRTGRERDAAQAQLAQVQSQYASVTQLAAAPDARGSSGAGARGGSAFVIASQELNKGVLLVSGLPTPPAGRTYQAWLIGDGHPRSVGLLAAGPSGRAVPLQFSGLGDASKFGLTLEPAGGSPQPTTTPVVLIDMPA